MNKVLQGLSFSAGKRRGRSTVGAAGVGVLCLSLAVLGTISSTASGSATSRAPLAAASTSKKLTSIVVQLALVPPKMVFLGFYAAQDKGFYAKNGLDVQLVAESTGVQAVRGMVAGHGFFAAGGSDGLASAAAAGGKYKGIWNYASNDFSIIATKEITSLKDLAGKTIGITDKVGPAYTLPLIAMSTVGLTASSAEFAILGGRPALVSALVSRKIQAAAFHVDDGLTVVKKDPTLHVLANMSKLVPKWWYGTLLVDDSYARAHRAVVKALVTSLIQADRWMLANRTETIALGVKYTGFDPDVVAQAYDVIKANNNWATGNEGMNSTNVNYTLAFYKSSGVVPKGSKINYGNIIDTSYVRDVLKKIGASTN
jgi:ABC-type nitrate/sulfonate/bicarbonate transport system substrate-binding protein